MFKNRRCSFGQEKVIFECMACGYQSPKWMGKCPNCGAWNQMEEIIEKTSNPKHGVKAKETQAKVQKLNSIKHEATPRVQTDSKEFNRVLGGGIVSITRTDWRRPGYWEIYIIITDLCIVITET